jgi:anti-sigma B factor antagonist
MSAHVSGSYALRPSSPRVSRARTKAIRRRLDRCYVVVHPPAELDIATAPAFAERLLAVEDNSDIVIDLRELRFCGSAGIAVLLDAQRHADAHDCTLTLSSPPPMFERVLEICGLTDRFNVRRPTTRRERRLSGSDPARR